MKVLIVKLSSMGDLIGTLPALTDAKNAIKDISFDWVAEENFVEIPHWHPAVDLVIPIALRRWRKILWSPSVIKEFYCFLKKLRLRKYDYIIDAHGLFKSAIVALMARGPRYGFSFNNAREPFASFLYNKKFDVEKNRHVTERLRKLFSSALGYEIDYETLDYGILDSFPGHKHAGAGSQAPRDDDLSNEKYLVFAHGTSRDNKCWPEKNWLELAKLAENAGFKVKLPWGNNKEFARAKRIAQATTNAELLPNMTLTEMGAVLFHAKGVVAVDTGFGHLAAALTVPTISLYGPTDPNRGGAYGKNQIHITNMSTLNGEIVWKKIKAEWRFTK